jgi:hypothetical protein
MPELATEQEATLVVALAILTAEAQQELAILTAAGLDATTAAAFMNCKGVN